MKAILRFSDGQTQITNVHASEDASGNVYILEEIRFQWGNGGHKSFRLVGIRTANETEYAEYREINDFKKDATLDKSG
jgi:hypothetical protein